MRIMSGFIRVGTFLSREKGNDERHALSKKWVFWMGVAGATGMDVTDYLDREERIKQYRIDVPVRIREKMDREGIENADIATELGVSVFTVDSITSGRTKVNPADLPVIARVLKCSTDYLLEGKEHGIVLCDEMADLLKGMTPGRQREVARGLREIMHG